MSSGDDSPVRILIGERPEVTPPSRRAKHLRGGNTSDVPKRAHSYVISTVGDVFAVVPYDRSGKPIRLHALGSATYPSIETASEAIRSYEAAETRSRSREDG